MFLSAHLKHYLGQYLCMYQTLFANQQVYHKGATNHLYLNLDSLIHQFLEILLNNHL